MGFPYLLVDPQHRIDVQAVVPPGRTLVEEAQLRFANNDVFQFEKLFVDFDSFSQVEGEYIVPLVSIHPDDFFRVFSNIVSNAIEHGFKGKENNIIRTSLSFDAENLLCVLEVSNNGAPMDESFTIKHLTTRGEKTLDSKGSGIGGADIKSIVEKYDGFIDIRKDNNADFSVTYIVSLPIIVYQL
ncbi:MAG: GHKL domain-containing protein [Proteobacteria bacterium]|nr:MAG: GHKL domain-containing protein [Pseudomonadota bacterium]